MVRGFSKRSGCDWIAFIDLARQGIGIAQRFRDNNARLVYAGGRSPETLLRYAAGDLVAAKDRKRLLVSSPRLKCRLNFGAKAVGDSLAFAQVGVDLLP
jgi:hypothetical protein